MAINTGLAQLSEFLWTGATGTYMLAAVAYTGEYAFGRTGRIAKTSVTAVTREPALVGAGVGAASGSASAVGATSARDIDASSPPVEPAPQRDAGRTWGRAAIAFTILGLSLHIACVLIRGIAVDRVPWGNMYEFTLVVGMIATIAWLATLVRMPQLRYLGLFIMFPVLVVMFLAGTLYTKASKLVPALQSYWLAIHVSSVAVAEGILVTSAAITIMYLIRSRYERGQAAIEAGQPGPRRFATLGEQFPASASLDKAAYRTVAFAFPIYTAGVIFGAIWAEAAWGRYWGWDPKETWAFIAWVVYAGYLHARATAGWKGSRAAWINLLGFGAMTFNFFVVNIVISGLHSYAGLN
ncbi:c-type cytochrome biogenesis protein CcsB [Jatrophihabitans telluris]|uniref:C-type cytochrome biogenesis protein CcsB n=1 Tax=Jatrophihabitans telluris TaxID=2038343 RepID=A0ABY4R1I0_9ACTN|nr:c-type cytochrome biogenesis protein CcsB [Jatrophihabitans telluris]UQX88884.1 c-type cytochrome biogenesis protein CcsB [Jatrophihabitans telluris]